jgi:hypothetical protein
MIKGARANMTISESARRNIIRTIKSEGIKWSGSLDEVDFLSRIYDLDKLPSYDFRYDSAKEDIYQHRINNLDWQDDWIFDDERFDLMHCADDKFLRFLCEMIDPIVRQDVEETQNLLELFNEQVKPEGYQIIEEKTRFGRVHYVHSGILPKIIDALDQVKDSAEELNSVHLQLEIVRMNSAVQADPPLAIGTAKEFLETICKSILKAVNKPMKGSEDLPELMKLTIEKINPLKLEQTDPEAYKLVRKTLGSLYTLTQSVAELRNKYGTGHGQDKEVIILEPRYAALIVNAAATLALFLYEAYMSMPKE